MKRRAFLRGAAGVVVGLPLLASLAPRRTRAQSLAPPKRFVVVWHPNGVVREAWAPTPGVDATDFVLGRCHEPLAPFKDRLLLPSGVDMPACMQGPGDAHQRGMGGVLTARPLNAGTYAGGDGSTAGFATGISVDQRIADAIGATTRFKSLELGVRADADTTTAEPRSRLIYRGNDQPLPPVCDPAALHARLFGDGAPSTAAALDAVLAQRRSVLDAVQMQLATLSTRVGAEDRRALEAHLALVRDVEMRLATAAPTLTDACATPAAPPSMIVDDETTMQQVSRLMIDQLVLSFACDHARVASIQYGNAVNHLRYPWVDSLGDGHALSHAGPTNTDARDELVARTTWHAGELAYLLDRLASVPEGDGTLLDRTAVLWASEVSVGNVHSLLDMPFLIAGSAGGAIATGRALSFDGASHADLMLALLRAYDVDDETFGDPAYCTGVLSGVLA